MTCARPVSTRICSNKKERVGMLATVGAFYLSNFIRISVFIEDVAAILFLASKEAKWITGLVMPVDGGVSSHLAIS